MNCYEHRDRVAIGVCKSCGKGLCEECVEEVQNGLACKDKCVEEVIMQNKDMKHNRQLMIVQKSMSKVAIWILVSGGLVVFITGIIALIMNNSEGWIGIVTGGMMFLLVVVVWRQFRKWPVIKMSEWDAPR